MPTVLRIDPLRAPACVNAVGTDSMGDEYTILQIGTNDWVRRTGAILSRKRADALAVSQGIDYILTTYADGRQGYYYFNCEGKVWENRGGQDGRHGGRLIVCDDLLPPVPLTYLQHCSAGSVKCIAHRYTASSGGSQAQQQRYRQVEAMGLHLTNLGSSERPSPWPQLRLACCKCHFSCQ